MAWKIVANGHEVEKGADRDHSLSKLMTFLSCVLFTIKFYNDIRLFFFVLRLIHMRHTTTF